MSDHKPPFDGIRIIEATQGVGGPMTAWLLAEQGAEVIKVEPPGGDRLRGEAAFHVLNRGKKSVVLDLETEAGRARLWQLLEAADGFVYDWRPGEDARLGLSADAIKKRCPDLVVGYLPAYGSRGPLASYPADEALVQAVSAICDAQYRFDPRPVMINVPAAGYAQGIVAAVSLAASLYARMSSGQADRFELSAIAATFAMQTGAWVRSPNVQRMAGQNDPRGPMPTYRLVQASDGEWLFCGALTPQFWTKLAMALGLEEMLVDERFKGAPLGIPEIEDRRELGRRVIEAFKTKTRDEWLRILEEADVPRGPVMTREQWAGDAHVVENGLMVEIDDPVLGRTRQMGLPLAMRNSPGRVGGAAPALGANNEDVLHQIERPIETSGDGGSPKTGARSYPLEGITVVDLSGFIAGANASMMLSDLGANVIKIEPPGGEGWRTSGLGFLGANRGKRSVCIDLRRPEGLELLLEMIDRADVLHDNFRHGVMERMGLTWETLSKRNPRLVWSSVTGYGPSGPLSHLPGFDPMMQARGGIMRAQGGSDPGDQPVYLQLAICDYATALTAAFGIVSALAARERTGLGDRVETSLARSAFTTQAGEYIFYDGKAPDRPGGRDYAGHHALYRVYPTADGFLVVACITQEQAAAFARVTAIDIPAPVLAHETHGAMASAIEQALATDTAQAWVTRLLAVEVPAARCVSVSELFGNEQIAANDLWWDFDHPTWGPVRQTGTLIKWQQMSMHLQRRAPLAGEHTLECLAELGIDRARVDALIAAGVLAQANAG